jgi:DNA-binding transcriptional ArsR family regulator
MWHDATTGFPLLSPMRPLHHPQAEDISLVGVLYALGDPVRLRIVQRLSVVGELACSDLTCSIPKSTMTHHLKILRESGVLLTRKEGTQHINTLRKNDIDRLFPGLLTVVLQPQDDKTITPKII